MNQKAGSLRNTSLLRFRTITILEIIAKIMQSRISTIENRRVCGVVTAVGELSCSFSAQTLMTDVAVAIIFFPATVRVCAS